MLTLNPSTLAVESFSIATASRPDIQPTAGDECAPTAGDACPAETPLCGEPILTDLSCPCLTDNCMPTEAGAGGC